MSVTHKWEIVRLVQLNDGTGVVSQVTYRVTSVDGDLEVVDEANVNLSTEGVVDFIPYNELDEQTILSWVKTKLAQESRDPEGRNIYVMNVMRNPPKPETIEAPLPWA